MKSKKVLAVVLALSVMATSALVGCKSEKKTASTATTTTESKIDKDQYLNYVLVADPRTLDASLNDDTTGGLILAATNEALTRVEKDDQGNDKIVPGGAESWKLSDDKLTWTFSLRDFQWTDGKKVTAEDYAYSIMRSLNPDTGSTYSQLLLPIKGAEAYNGGKGKAEDVGVKAVDEKTLEIKLERPTPYFMQLTYFPLLMPQRKDMIDKYGAKYGSEAETIISCGPFELKEWVHDSKLSFEKNTKYWDAGKVKLSKITMPIIKEEDARMNELLNGSIDTAAVSSEDYIKKFKADSNFTAQENFQPCTAYFLWNEKVDIKVGDKTVKLFSNQKVRRAFSLALDREQTAEVIFGGTAVPAYSWTPPTLLIGTEDFRKKANDEQLKKLKDEVKDPKELLKEGLKELGCDPDPSKVEVVYAVGNTTAKGKSNAELYQNMFQTALGVKVKIEQMESAKRMAKINKTFDYQIASLAWLGDYNDPSTFFNMWLTDRPNYKTGYANTKFDEYVNKAAQISDDQERFTLYKQAEDLLVYEDAVIAPTVYYKNSTFTNKYVKGLLTPLFGPVVDFKYAYTEGRK